MNDRHDIMVIVECADGRVNQEAYALIAFARQLQTLRPGGLAVWLTGVPDHAAAEDISRRAAVHVTMLLPADEGENASNAYGPSLEAEIKNLKPRYVCVSHNSRGWEWAPAAAARIDAGCITGVETVILANNRLCFQKDLYMGKIKGFFDTEASTTIITILPGSYVFSRPEPSAPVSVTRLPCNHSTSRVRFLGKRQAPADTAHIASASAIVAVGNGIGEQENMVLIDKLAALIPKAAVAGSRTVCDRGWLGYDRQVGVTGATVAPAVYIACGISGASQHIMGMRASKCVIAINTDARAPIFNHADFCIQADITRLIPLIAERYRLRRYQKPIDPLPADAGSKQEE